METREAPLKQEQKSNQENLIIDFSASSIASDNHPDRNEDTHFFDSEIGIFGIFDGMGGEKNGQWSAQACCQIIGDYLKYQSQLNSENGYEILTNARNLANRAVYSENKGEGGTTATFGFFSKTKEGVNQINLLHVGDSRVYLFHEGKLIQLTEDDSSLKNFDEDVRKIIQSRLDNATNRIELSNLEYNEFRKRSEIIGCIGTDKDINTDIITEPVTLGDLVIFTTDGIHDNLTTTEISQIISENIKNPDLISEKLTSASLARSREGVFRSKPDDMTALVVTFKKDNKQ